MVLERVVYILGAGFSAPLGIPVIRNFVEKSKDLFFNEPNRYEGFKGVLSKIDKMAICKSYYTADMFDIEEVLSTLDLLAFVGEPLPRELFVEYIRDVIASYTPDFKLRHRTADDPTRGLFRDAGDVYSLYAYFVLGLFQLQPAFQFGKGGSLLVPLVNSVPGVKSIRYDVITLNYDLVLENLAGQFIYREKPLTFNAEASNDGLPTLVKLHGSVDSQIVLPTWHKGGEQGIAETWKKALNLLQQANQIRFVGYSLPSSDNYIRHLLKAAVIETPHLKRIDAICLDGESKVERRYREFVAFHNFRYRNANVLEYLRPLFYTDLPTPRDEYSLQQYIPLETVHNRLMIS